MAPMSAERASPRVVDPRAVRVTVATTPTTVQVPPIVVQPSAMPLAPTPRSAGAKVRKGDAAAPAPFAPVSPAPTADHADELVLVDGAPARVGLDHLDRIHGLLVERRGRDTSRTAVMMLPLERAVGPGIGLARREVVVDGWRVEVEIESERRASLRERARRGSAGPAQDGPTDIHAIIPGQVVEVSVVPGDSVVGGQQLLVVEAMKMQNELKAPRDGVISRVAVGPGQTIEVGDLLLVLE